MLQHGQALKMYAKAKGAKRPHMISAKCPQQTNPERQKVDLCLPRARRGLRGNEERLLTRTLGDGKCSETDRGDACTTV